VEPSTVSRAWLIGISGWCMLVLSNPLQCLSSRRCSSSQGRGQHLSLAETVPVAPPSSPPSSCCSCALTPPCLPSRACRFSSDLFDEAYKAYGRGSCLCHARYGIAVGPSGQGTRHPSPRLVYSDRPEGRILYFHVSILPRHKPFLRFVFEGLSISFLTQTARVIKSCLIWTSL